MKAHNISACIASFALVSAIMFYFIAMTPLMADNFVFSRILEPGFDRFYSGDEVAASPLTLGASLAQAKYMYFNWCGRFAGNLAVYLLFLLPRWLYCLCAALCFSFYLLLLLVCVLGKGWRQRVTSGWIFGMGALLWGTIPSFGETFLWLSVGGQLALLGQALVFLPLRFALDRRGPPAAQNSFLSLIKGAVLFFLGAITASLDYPTSAALPPTAIACTAWIYFRQKKSLRKVPWQLLFLCCGLCLGAALTIGAPGNSMRLLLTRDPEVHAWLAASWGWRITDWLLHIPVVICLLVIPIAWLLWGLAALRAHYGKAWLSQIPCAAGLFLMPAILTICSYLFTAWPPPRAFATVCVQMILTAATVFAAARQYAPRSLWKPFSVLRTVFVVYCIVSLPMEGLKFFEMNKITVQREKILLDAAGKTAELPPYPAYSDDRYWVLGGNLADLAQETDFWVNRAIALHYGLESAVLSPQPGVTLTSENFFPDKAALSVQGTRITAEFKGETVRATKDVHVYYYGKPAILDLLPPFVARPIFNWLVNGKQDSLREKLVPLLLARADIRLLPGGDNALTGKSDLLKIRDNSRLWLVRPGEDKFSFDLLPFAPRGFSGG